MHLASATTLLLAAGAAMCAPLTTRATDPIIAVAEGDIGAISSAVQQVTAAVNAYQGGVAAAAPILADATNVHLVNRKAFADAAAAATAGIKATEAESEAIVTFTENSVGQTIPESIAALKAKGALLTKAGLKNSVVALLKLLKSDHESYSKELLLEVAPGQVKRADAVVLKIDNAIQDGITYFEAQK